MHDNAPPLSPAADRNKQPILDVLLELLPPTGRALEIAAGTGQHAVWFASALAGWRWQPTDVGPDALHAIAAQQRMSGADKLCEPLELDVLAPQWPSQGAAFSEPFDLVYCANMVHIAPWACCAALMQGSRRHLSAQGRLVMYGPFFERGVDPAPGNLAFDQSLRARDPDWGIRHLDDVEAQAGLAGLRLLSRHAMPANNLLLVWGPAPDGAPAARSHR
jgi:hypothetical protein